jgi:hypothetical protein
MADITYTQLDGSSRLALINSRRRDLESQHFAIQLRIQAPAPGDVITDQDTANSTELQNSIAALQTLADSITAAPTAPAA